VVRETWLHPDEQREASEEQGYGEQGEVERRQPARKRTLEDHSPVCTHQVGQRVVVVYESQVLRQRLGRPEDGCDEESPSNDGSEDLAHVGHEVPDARHDVGQAQGEQQLQHDDQGKQQDLPVQPVLQNEDDEYERTNAEELVHQRSYRVRKGEQFKREDHLLHQPRVVPYAVESLGQRFGEGHEREQTAVQEQPEVERWIVLYLPEPQADHLREDQRQEEDPDQGSQYGPRQAQIGSLVATGYLAADKVSQQPTLAVERRQGVEELTREAFLTVIRVGGQLRPSCRRRRRP